MNFVKLYIGDYLRDTGTLTLAQHGAYTLMLLEFYATEKPLPEGRELHRLLRADSKSERDAIDFVAAKFWTREGSGLVNKRGLQEIGRADHQRSVNREIGKRGGRPKITERITESVSESEPKAEPNRNPNQTPDTRQIQEEASPPVDSPPLATPQRPPCPTEEVVSLYHELCPSLPRVSVLNDARRKAISTRWREVITDPEIRKAEDPKTAALDWWGWFFREVHASDFLAGRAREWHASFDWLMKPTNFAKVVDGNFSNKRRTA